MKKMPRTKSATTSENKPLPQAPASETKPVTPAKPQRKPETTSEPKTRKPRQAKPESEEVDLGLRDGLPQAKEKPPRRTGKRKKVAIEVPYTRDEVLALIGILKDAETIAANDIEVCKAGLARFAGNVKAIEALNRTIDECQEDIKQIRAIVLKTAELESKMPLD